MVDQCIISLNGVEVVKYDKEKINRLNVWFGALRGDGVRLGWL